MWEQHIMGILYQNYGEMADLALSLKGLRRFFARIGVPTTMI